MHTNSTRMIKERGKHPMSITPPIVAGFVLTVLLFVTLVTLLPRNMAAAPPTHRKRHITFLIGSSVLISFFLIIIMIDIAALIAPIN